MRFGYTSIVAFLAIGFLCGGTEAGQEGTDMELEDMGFIMRMANTQEQMARLRLLPPRRFVARTNSGARYYLYADPDYCQCVFLGNENAMTNYQALNAPPSPPPMAVGPGGGPLPDPLIQEIDPTINVMIGNGDILDYSSY
jgi:hypothetical protein